LFGVRVPSSGPLSSIENIVKATKQAELGFDSIWVTTTWSGARRCTGPHLFRRRGSAHARRRELFEATTMLSYLAGETKDHARRGLPGHALPQPIYA
jgi:alkanesulfonate monooxygenase SsuD/methylene tetrahydromethanopterin reductase-like flavin-dependent oxidoreductase (luciferase family)